MNQKISQKIKSFFEKKPEVIAVFIFGSVAKQKATQASDVDIAVLFDPKQIPDFRIQLALKEALTSLLKNEVDLVVMNQANPILIHQVFKYGEKILNQNPTQLNLFFVKSLMSYDDLKRIRAPIEQNLLKGRRYG